MRASNMQEFWTRAGELQGHEHEQMHRAWSTNQVWVTTWQYESGVAVFDGRDWSFKLEEGVRA